MNVSYIKVKYCFGIFLLGWSALGFAADGGQTLSEVDAFLGKQREAQVEAEPLVGDRGFLRRVWLDLTGRLPDPETIAAFLGDTRPEKRSLMIQAILESEAFNNRWSNFLGELFQNAPIGEEAPFRNAFYFELKEMVAQNIPWDQMVREILTDRSVEADERSALVYWIRDITLDYRPDELDDQIGKISAAMLGMRIDCISCHDGAYHLEEVNKGLATMTREQFWGMAAFLSQSYIYYERLDSGPESQSHMLKFVDLDDPDLNLGEGFLFALPGFDDGQYRAISEAGEGMRPPRQGGLIEPAYLTSGEQPLPGETRRQALARMITADRQFARNMVNRIWAVLFGEGFVEPLDGWDLGRIDRAAAELHQTTVQPKTLFLMEFLTDLFIDNGYDFRNFIGQIANSKLYQWDYAAADSDPQHPWYEWRSKNRVRRLEAEAIVDSIHQVLGLEQRYLVRGLLDRTYQSAWQMPDASEPNPNALFRGAGFARGLRISPELLGYASLDDYDFQQNRAYLLLQQLGRGDVENNRPRANEVSIPGILSMMNQLDHNYWLEFWAGVPLIRDLSARLGQGRLSRRDATTDLFHHILFRDPTEAEMALFLNYFNAHDESRAVRDMVWALLNHPDFIHK